MVAYCRNWRRRLNIRIFLARIQFTKQQIFNYTKMHFLPNINANFQSSKTSITKTSINPSFQEKLVPKIKYIPNEISQSEQVKFVNYKYDIWNCGPWSEVKTWGRFKIAMCPMCTQTKSNLLIMNILIVIDIWRDPKSAHVTYIFSLLLITLGVTI